MAKLAPDQRWAAYQRMKMGALPILGPEGQVPPAVLGEYVTLAYLKTWGMLRKSLGERGARLLDGARVRWIGRTPVAALYQLFRLIRRDRTTAVAVIALYYGFVIGVGFLAYQTGNKWGLVASVLGSVLGLAGLALFSSRPRTGCCRASKRSAKK